MAKRVLLDFSSENEGAVSTEIDEKEEIILEKESDKVSETGDESEDPIEKVETEDSTEDSEEDLEEGGEEIDEDESDDEEVDNEAEDDLDGDDISGAYKAFADTIKSVGLLPPELDIPEDVTGEGLIQGVQEHLVPKFKQQAFNEVQTWLIDQGITQQNLVQLKALSTGAPEKLITDLNTYNSIRSIEDIDELEDNRKEELVRFMFSDKGVDKVAVDATINTHRDDLDPLVKKAIEYADSKYTRLEKAEIDRQKKIDNDRIEQENYKTQYIQSVFTSAKLGDHTLDESDLVLIRDSLFNRNRQIDVAGQRKVVTLYDEFNHKINTDIDFQMKIFYELINREKIFKGIQQKTAEDVEKDFLKKIPNKTVSKKRVKSSKKVSKKSSKKPNKLTFNSYDESEINNTY